jgi:resuscitation-promoting factor RpfE
VKRKLYLTVCSLLILITPVALNIDAAGAEEVNAHYISEFHQSHQECQYSQRVVTRRPSTGGFYCQGRVNQWRTDSDHEWRDYKRQAKQLRRYLIAVYAAHSHQSLVDRWSGVAECESGGNWAINTGNGYYGGLQFTLGTWEAYGGQGMPHEQPAWYQAQIADNLRIQSGLGAWPVCGSHYG